MGQRHGTLQRVANLMVNGYDGAEHYAIKWAGGVAHDRAKAMSPQGPTRDAWGYR